MGKKNNKITPYLQKPENFCGLLNGGIFKGREVLNPEQLSLLSDVQSIDLTGTDMQGEDKKQSYIFYHDVVMKADWGGYYAIMSCENQNHVHYGMPIRMLQYDILEYMRQMKEMEDINKNNGILKTSAEFLSGMKKGDLLQPVVGVVFYHGEEPWDGPRSIEDMVYLPEELEELREYIPKYKIHIIEPRTVELDAFVGDWRILMEALRYMGDKQGFSAYIEKHAKELEELSIESGEVLLTLLGEEKYLKEGKEGVTVCTALEELKIDWKNEGRNEGRNEGISIGEHLGEKKMVTLILHMIEDGMIGEVARLETDQQFKEEMILKYQIQT